MLLFFCFSFSIFCITSSNLYLFFSKLQRKQKYTKWSIHTAMLHRRGTHTLSPHSNWKRNTISLEYKHKFHDITGIVDKLLRSQFTPFHFLLCGSNSWYFGHVHVKKASTLPIRHLHTVFSDWNLKNQLILFLGTLSYFSHWSASIFTYIIL